MHNQYKVPKSKCPVCGELLTAVTPTQTPRVPKPNDITICLYCVAVLCFNDDFSLRTATPQDVQGIEAQVNSVVNSIRRFNHDRAIN